MGLQDFVAERQKINDERKLLLSKADSEKRDLTAEESERFDRLHDEDGKLKARIDRMRQVESADFELGESQGRRSEPGPVHREERSREVAVLSREEQYASGIEGFRTWLLAGSTKRNVLKPEQIAGARRVGFDPDQRVVELNLPMVAARTIEEARTMQYRAMGVATGPTGLYGVPDEMMRPLEVALLTFGGMRQVATVIRTDTGADLPIPMVNDVTNKGEIVLENTTVNAQDLALTSLVLHSYKYSSKMVLVSVELMQDNAINLANFLGEALGTRIGRITNDHFTTGGGGVTAPSGIVTGATSGKAGATSQQAAVIIDDLIDLEHSVDPAYRNGARFMLHDSTLKVIKKIKDTSGRPVFLPGLATGTPDTILGYPYVINQSMDAVATTKKSILFGALDKYIIRDVRGITLLRLDERFAEFHQVAFLAFARMDGALMNAGTNPVKYFATVA